MNTPLLGSRILVPLDGSELAERALPAAELVARATSSSMVLARVIPHRPLLPTAHATPDLPSEYQESDDADYASEAAYLEHIAQDLREGGLAVQTLVARGEPAETLLDLVPQLHVGLIIMTTHGRTGLARIAVGSVADHLVRHGHIPVLLVRPFVETSRLRQLERAVVPLDGSELSESALEVAAPLAGRLIQHITLLRVVDLQGAPGATATADGYLAAQHTRFARHISRGTCVVSQHVVWGSPAERILQQATEEGAMVIMATHGETGFSRLALGSVADRVLHDADIPLLLVHPLDVGLAEARAEEYTTSSAAEMQGVPG